MQILLVGIAVLFVDQVTKTLAIQCLSRVSTLAVLPGIFHLTLVWNTGVAFGLFRGYSLAVALATTAILLGLIGMSLRRKGARGVQPVVSLGLILGGAIGNLIDRARFGAVVDFLDFRIWPVFNVADSCITVGVILMALALLKKR